MDLPPDHVSSTNRCGRRRRNIMKQARVDFVILLLLLVVLGDASEYIYCGCCCCHQRGHGGFYLRSRLDCCLLHGFNITFSASSSLVRRRIHDCLSDWCWFQFFFELTFNVRLAVGPSSVVDGFLLTLTDVLAVTTWELACRSTLLEREWEWEQREWGRNWAFFVCARTDGDWGRPAWSYQVKFLIYLIWIFLEQFFMVTMTISFVPRPIRWETGLN